MRSIIFIAAATVLLIASPSAHGLSLRYSCTYDLPMTNVYPPECYDPASDGIFHITDEISSRKKNGKIIYKVKTTKRWPIVGGSVCFSFSPSSTSQGAVTLSKRKGLIRLRSGAYTTIELTRPLGDTVSANHIVSRPELFMGGGCASCRDRISGSCTRTPQ